MKLIKESEGGSYCTFNGIFCSIATPTAELNAQLLCKTLDKATDSNMTLVSPLVSTVGDRGREVKRTILNREKTAVAISRDEKWISSRKKDEG